APRSSPTRRAPELRRPGLRRRPRPRAPRGPALRRGQDPGRGPRTERKRMTSQTDFDLSVTMTDDAPPPAGSSDGHAIETTDLDIYYGEFKAVEGVSFRVEPRSITAVIGPSGCGKSALLRR